GESEPKQRQPEIIRWHLVGEIVRSCAKESVAVRPPQIEIAHPLRQLAGAPQSLGERIGDGLAQVTKLGTERQLAASNDCAVACQDLFRQRCSRTWESDDED